MLTIRFYPESDKVQSVELALRYQHIWEEEGRQIIEALEQYSGLHFPDMHLNVLVDSRTGEMGHKELQLSNSPILIREALVRRLGQRLLFENGIRVEHEDMNKAFYTLHKILYLFLYDTWLKLYGDDLTKKIISEKRQRQHRDLIPLEDVLVISDVTQRVSELQKLLSMYHSVSR